MKLIKEFVAVLIMANLFIMTGLAENFSLDGMLPGVSVLSVAAQVPTVNTDRCTTGLKQVVPFNISSATTTSLIAPVTGTNIYICGFDINQAGGTGTILFEYGTGATCGTGTQTLTGPFTANTSAGTTTNIVVPDNGSNQLATSFGGALVPSQRLCALSTGTIVQSGYILYVQE